VPKILKHAQILKQFSLEFKPLEENGSLFMLEDKCTGASYCECHIKASAMVPLSTLDVPLDPEVQSEYRANREINENHPAFKKMQEDAEKGRAFSNIVAEYIKDFDKAHPLKIVGGQHRFRAIKDAMAKHVDEYHQVKVYFKLDINQRLDVQLISNTNIAISPDLFDRMQETVQGPQLRNWCHTVGLLPLGQDIAYQYFRGGPISVRMARSFITNYINGTAVDPDRFRDTNTTPVLCETGENDPMWEALKNKTLGLWASPKLLEAAKEFSLLVKAQRDAFAGKRGIRPDYPEKALNAAVYSAWFYVAGILRDNPVRLERHFALKNFSTKDPLYAEALAKGKHKTDSDNYRGLGYRTDPQERGRMVELFYLQAETGKGITKRAIDAAIAAWHAKDATLVSQKKRERV